MREFYWHKEEIQSKQKKIMIDAFYDVFKIMEEFQVDMRTAAYIKAISSIAEAMRIRGWC